MLAMERCPFVEVAFEEELTAIPKGISRNSGRKNKNGIK